MPPLSPTSPASSTLSTSTRGSDGSSDSATSSVVYADESIDGSSLVPHAMIGIDRGARHRGFAHKPAQLSMAIPIGEYEIATTHEGVTMTCELVQRYRVGAVVVGRVADQRRQIDDVMSQLLIALPPDVRLLRTNEAYTSVIADEQMRGAGRYASSHALAGVQMIERALAGYAQYVMSADEMADGRGDNGERCDIGIDIDD